jgi:hypothetical protein
MTSDRGLTLAFAFERKIQVEGMHAALGFLNSTTPYRLTGVYRFDGDLVRSIVLVDRKNPDLTLGLDVPWNDSYCRLTAENGARCEIIDAPTDARLTAHAAREAVQAYVAVLLKTPEGAPWGTLCHYDLQPVTPPLGIFEDLDAVCPAVERAVLKLAHVEGATPILNAVQGKRLPGAIRHPSRLRSVSHRRPA